MASALEASKLASRRRIWHNLCMAGYWTGSHTRHKLQLHIVWVPKYRKRILRGEIVRRLKQMLYEGCKMNRWWIGEINIQTDHVHVMIQIKPKDSVGNVVNALKGATSYKLRKEFPEFEEFLWGDSFWADGYFAEKVGAVDEEVIRRYIKEQQR